MWKPARENIIVAMTDAGVIGTPTGLPWQLPEELRLFRSLTWGGTLVMGRRTYQSIGRPLPGRRMLVVSTTLTAQEGVTLCRDFASAVAEALRHPAPVFYAGGRSIYQQALPRAEALLISWIRGDHAGTVRFPAWDREPWEKIGCEAFPDFVFCHYRRRGATPVFAP